MESRPETLTAKFMTLKEYKCVYYLSYNTSFSYWVALGLLLNIDIDFDIIAFGELGQINWENIANILKSTHKFEK